MSTKVYYLLIDSLFGEVQLFIGIDMLDKLHSGSVHAGGMMALDMIIMQVIQMLFMMLGWHRIIVT